MDPEPGEREIGSRAEGCAMDDDYSVWESSNEVRDEVSNAQVRKPKPL